VDISHRRDYDDPNAVVVVKYHYQGYQLHAKSASTRKYPRCSGSLCSSAAYNQGRLTIKQIRCAFCYAFYLILCWLQVRSLLL